jgi:hypothetical protein
VHLLTRVGCSASEPNGDAIRVGCCRSGRDTILRVWLLWHMTLGLSLLFPPLELSCTPRQTSSAVCVLLGSPFSNCSVRRTSLRGGHSRCCKWCGGDPVSSDAPGLFCGVLLRSRSQQTLPLHHFLIKRLPLRIRGTQ